MILMMACDCRAYSKVGADVAGDLGDLAVTLSYVTLIF